MLSCSNSSDVLACCSIHRLSRSTLDRGCWSRDLSSFVTCAPSSFVFSLSFSLCVSLIVYLNALHALALTFWTRTQPRGATGDGKDAVEWQRRAAYPRGAVHECLSTGMSTANPLSPFGLRGRARCAADLPQALNSGHNRHRGRFEKFLRLSER